MHFTVVFDGIEGCGASYSLCFVPNPCWFVGSTNILKLDYWFPQPASLPSSSIRPLLKRVQRDLGVVRISRCVIVVHPIGHGSEVELTRLIADCEAESIVVSSVVRFPTANEDANVNEPPNRQ